MAAAGAYIDLEAFATEPTLLLVVYRHALTEDRLVIGIYNRQLHVACREAISSPLLAKGSLEVALDKFESCALCAIVLTAKKDALLLAFALECLTFLGCVEGICLSELAQIHVHRVSDAIQPSHPLSSPSPAFNLSQHQGLFQ